MIRLLERIGLRAPREREPQPGDPGHRGYQMPVVRTCECGHTHECRETFREMVDRCAEERDGSVIIC